MRAWLVTWEWMGDSAAVADKVVAVFNPRWSSHRVAMLVECLYVHATATISTAAEYAKRPSYNPYRARVEMDQQIICGRHPYLCARKVDRLEVLEDPETLLETIYWTELARHKYSEVKDSFIQLGEDRQVCYRRRKSGRVSNEIVWDRQKDAFKRGWEDYSIANVVEPAGGTDG